MSATAPADHLAAPPAFRDGARPRAESPRRVAAVRLVALAALAVTAAYLTWRIGAGTVNLAAWWVAVPLLVAEIHNAFGLLLYTVALWEVDGGPTPPRAAPVARPGLRVAVLIPTYNEPVEVLLPTVAASVALRPAHETWVLDDGRREDVRLIIP